MGVAPDLSRLSLNQIEELTGRSHRFVKRRLAAAGLDPVGKTGRARLYPAQAALAAVFSGPGGELDARQEKAALDRVRREREELELRKQRRELLPAAEVAMASAAVDVEVRTRVLGLPALAPKVHAAATPSEARRILEDGCRDALEAIADAEIEPPAAEGGDEGGEAA